MTAPAHKKTTSAVCPSKLILSFSSKSIAPCPNVTTAHLLQKYGSTSLSLLRGIIRNVPKSRSSFPSCAARWSSSPTAAAIQPQPLAGTYGVTVPKATPAWSALTGRSWRATHRKPAPSARASKGEKENIAVRQTATRSMRR